MSGPNHSIGTSSRVWSVPLPGRVAAMVGGDQRKIARAQRGAQFGQARIERFQRGRIARHVAAVAVERVEVDEVGEDERAVRGVPCFRERRVEHRHVVLRQDGARDAAMGEDVGDLADRHHGAAGRGDAIEQGVGVRRRGQVLAVGGAFEVFALSPTNGRAITRPMLSGSVSSLATAQTA